MTRWMWVVVLAGCGDDTYLPCAGGNVEVDGEVDTSGELPVFDWEFGSAYAVSVYELDGNEFGEEMWHVQCGGDNLEHADELEAQVCIRTPLVYGEEVLSENLDTRSLRPAKPLTPGARYVLWISTMIEEDSVVLERDRPDWLEFLAGDDSKNDDPNCGSAFSSEVEFVVPADM